MSLRTKTLLLMLLSLIIMIGALYLTARSTLMKGLEEIEEHDAKMNVERALAALSQEVSNLERVTVDWSSWDDTYRFIDDGNSQYIEGNLVDEAFVTLRLNLMLFVHSSGKVVFSKAFDLDSEKEIPVPSNFLGDFSSSTLPGPGGIASGVMLTRDGPMIIVAQPILTSKAEGPARGTLFFGRYLNDGLIANLSQVTLSDITLHRMDEPRPDFPASLLPPLSPAEDTAALVQVLDGQHMAAYSKVNDIYGRPILVLQITMPRDEYFLGQEAVTSFALVILGIALLIGGLLLWLVHNQILARVAILIAGINKISSSGDTSTRIELKGKDELALVAGTMNGMLTVLQEEEKELRDLLQKEKELRKNLEEEIEHRAEYTRALVHELKTPITPILAASELLLDEIEEPTAHSLAANIQRSASNLNRRIDELLDLARGETGQLKLSIAPVEIEKLLKETTDEARSQTSLKRQSLSLEILSPLQIIPADKERLQQVVQNLLNNAIKFTPEGGKIAVRAREDGTNLIVEVEDNGRGITEEEQKRLFNPYNRRESDRERLSGLGLGLTIAKRFVELHGGRIWVTSTDGKGTVFTFSIPLKPAEQGNQQTERGS